VPFYGAVVACVDDPHLASVLPQMSRRVLTYGLDAADAELTATNVQLAPLGVTATVKRRPRPSAVTHSETSDTLGLLTLHVPGRHNLQNALAAVSVGLELGLDFDRIAAGLAEFRGAERRFEVRGEPNGILVVDDYGHHPTEIAAVLAAARALNRPLVVAFQPHRFTRTAQLMESFGPALAGADRVVLTDIYSAGEEAIPGVTLDALAASIRRTANVPVDVARTLDEVVSTVVSVAKSGDVVITLGAGSIGAVPERLIDVLSRQDVASRETTS
jgi:UDP-N-acetylmuramate--alanine ligase